MTGIYDSISRCFGHEAVVFFVPSGIVIDLDDRIDAGVLANPTEVSFFDSIFIDEDTGECLGDSGFIDAEVDHALCELELELEWCHKVFTFAQENSNAIKIFVILCLTLYARTYFYIVHVCAYVEMHCNATRCFDVRQCIVETSVRQCKTKIYVDSRKRTPLFGCPPLPMTTA